MKLFEISESSVAEHYKVLNKLGCLGADPSAGFLRAAYSNEETEAIRYIEHKAIELGAQSSWDKLGNLSLSWPGTSAEFVETASHLDTVPRGGNFDGAAGVVSGLLAIEAIIKSKQPRSAGLRLRVWRAEESSTFNIVYIGSLSAFGQLNPKFLSNVFRGVTLEEAMKSQGADPTVVRNKIPTISQQEIDSIRAHIELHIEQGNMLEINNVDVGIVTSIRAPRRYRVVLRGEFDHSGATPMGTEYRRDVNLALAHILVRLDLLCSTELQRNADLVQTAGVINSSRDFNESHPLVYSNAVPKVSGFGYFCLDIRSADVIFLNEYCARVEKLVLDIAEKFRVSAEIELIGSSEPLQALAPNIQNAAEAAARALNVSTLRMPSGAGHDAAVVGAQRRSSGETVPVGMLFIPCRGGKSHCPEEYASHAAIAKGASVLAGALYSLASA